MLLQDPGPSAGALRLLGSRHGGARRAGGLRAELARTLPDGGAGSLEGLVTSGICMQRAREGVRETVGGWLGNGEQFITHSRESCQTFLREKTWTLGKGHFWKSPLSPSHDSSPIPSPSQRTALSTFSRGCSAENLQP